MNILSIWTDVREVFFNLDGVGFAFIDNIYKLFISIAKTTLLNQKELNTILRTMYVIVGIFALFRIALFLINMIINPDNFNKEKAGVSQIFINTVVMIVLLVVTPMAFQLSRDVASKIVEGNYIQNIFLNIGSGENSETKKQTEPGQDMKRIAIAAVLTIDERIPLGGTKTVTWGNDETQYNETIENTCSDCDDEASKAISCLYAIADGDPSGKYNIDSIREEDGGWKRLAAGYVTYIATMNPIAAYSAYKATGVALTRITGGCLNADGSVDWSELAYYSTVKQKVEDEKVYVYDYKPLVLLIIGVVITLVLLSFTLDVAKRMIELAVLEIVSPLFIATYIDPKSSKSGPFKNWLTAVGKSYASLFIRLAIISIMLLCIRLLNYIDLGDGIGAIGKLVILIAFLMFCKSAPKWIEGLIGIDGGVGGGLWTPKKIGENMVGTKALRTGAAIGTAAAANRIANLAENHRRRKEADKNAGLEGKDRLNLKKRREKRAEINAQREKNGATASKSFFRNMAGLGNAVVQGGKAGIGASTIGGALKGAADVNARFKEQHAMGPGLVGKAKNAIAGVAGKISNDIWGLDEYDRRQDAQKQANFEKYCTSTGKDGATYKDRICGQKDFNIRNSGLQTMEQCYAAEAWRNDLAKAGYKNIQFSVNDGELVAKVENASGQLETKALSMESGPGKEYVNKGMSYYTPEGQAFMRNAFDNMRQSDVNSYANAMQTQQQLVQSQSAATANTQAIADAITKGLNGAYINLSSRSAKTIADQIDTIPNSQVDEEAKAQLKKMAEQYEMAAKAENNISRQLEETQEIIEKTSSTVEGMKKDKDYIKAAGGNTPTLIEIQTKVAKDCEKSKEKLDSFKQTSGNDKK